MITKNIFKIHVLYYVVAFVSFLTGNFKNFIIFSAIIIVHETGHIVGALIFKWKIDKVILLPFGGITIFKENIDKPLKQELIIALLGPLFQILFYLIFKDNATFNHYNMAILLFNLLPIYPLDGSKILNIFFNELVSFKKSHILTIVVSEITLFFLLFKTRINLLLLLILFFLIVEIVKEFVKHKYYFNRFLLERYLYKYNFKKSKIVTKENNFKRDYHHLVKIDRKYFLEEEYLKNKYKNNRL